MVSFFLDNQKSYTTLDNMNNHRLTIRLDDVDIALLEYLKQNSIYSSMTTNAAIKLALKQATQLNKLLEELKGLFTQTWTVDQKTFLKLNKEYGFSQKNLFHE